MSYLQKTCKDLDEICKDILNGADKYMKEKIIGFFREYVFVLGIITTIIGLIMVLMGAIYILAPSLELGSFTNAINLMGNYNAYVLTVGLFVLLIGVYYIYSFLKNKKFLLEEIETNKRSEFLKKHCELKNVVRHLPSKYKDMLKEKENELNIK